MVPERRTATRYNHILEFEKALKERVKFKYCR